MFFGWMSKKINGMNHKHGTCSGSVNTWFNLLWTSIINISLPCEDKASQARAEIQNLNRSSCWSSGQVRIKNWPIQHPDHLKSQTSLLYLHEPLSISLSNSQLTTLRVDIRALKKNKKQSMQYDVTRWHVINKWVKLDNSGSSCRGEYKLCDTVYN